MLVRFNIKNFLSFEERWGLLSEGIVVSEWLTKLSCDSETDLFYKSGPVYATLFPVGEVDERK